jgi:hypothetical protein
MAGTAVNGVEAMATTLSLTLETLIKLVAGIAHGIGELGQDLDTLVTITAEVTATKASDAKKPKNVEWWRSLGKDNGEDGMVTTKNDAFDWWVPKDFDMD